MFRIVVVVVMFLVVGCGEEEDRDRVRGRGDAFVVGLAEVKDGDSFVVSGEEVRLLGIDAPERGQFCGEGDGDGDGDGVWDCGEAARVMLEGIVEGKEVRCELSFRDVHGRWLSRCFVGGDGDSGDDLGKLMVAEGMAVATGKEYRLLMRGVQGERRGIWEGCLEKPERWRAGRRGCWHR